MKKLISVLLSLSMLSVLSACSGDETESQTSSEETAAVTEEITDVPADESGGESGNSASASLPDGVTFAQYLLDDFKTMMSDNPDMDTEELAAELSANEMILFSSMTMPVEPGFLSGFSQEITGFDSAVMFGPAMGSIAFIGYVFELDDDESAKAFTETLTSNADPRWQICVEAEETVCEAVGDKVFFVMAPMSNQ